MMDLDLLKITAIKPNKANPRVIKDAKFHKLVKSILVLPQMLQLRPIVITADRTVLGGNMRLKALEHIASLSMAERQRIMEESSDYNLKPDAAKDALFSYWAKFDDERKVPVVKASDLTDAEQREFIIKDNASFGEWDWDMLANEWDADLLGDWGVELPDFNAEEELSEEVKEVKEDDYDANGAPQRCHDGELWRLGQHLLLCGDSTKDESYVRLMHGGKAVCLFTDPPYGMKKEGDGIANDNLNYEDLLRFNQEWIPRCIDALTDNGSLYIWGIEEPLFDIYAWLRPRIKKRDLSFRNLICWDKGDGVQGQLSELRRMYPRGNELCLFLMKGAQVQSTTQEEYWEGWEPIRAYLAEEAEKCGLTPKRVQEITGVGMYSHWFSKSQWSLIPEHHYNALREATSVFRKEYEVIRKEWYATRAFFDNTHDKMTNVWRFPITSQEERVLTGGHATPKPISLCARAIKSSTREGDIVLDVFGGSGSTLIACEQLNRQCRMIELSPRYCDVIIHRWETITGNSAELILE